MTSLSTVTSPIRLPDEREVDRLAERFAHARPFPHVVLRDLIDPGVDLDTCFPTAQWDGWHRFGDANQAGKRLCSDIERMPAPLREAIVALSSPRALSTIERITGIDKLIPDPYLNGGGLHSSVAGGVLTPHTDFHVYQRLDLYRQVNLLLYLNHGWDPHDGGALELYEDASATTSSVQVQPEYGTSVIFRTDDRSVHGFPTPLRRERHSIALYYYTARESASFGGGTTTYWRRPAGSAGRVRGSVYRGALFTSRAFSWIAHRAQPPS
jgi:hypothetical protein